MLKKFSPLIVVLSLFACSGDKNADTQMPAANSVEKFTEGTHYTRINNAPAATNDKIVVTEFFWYGCTHCEHFEPVLAAWSKNKAADVVLQRSPVVWREPMKLHAQVFYLIQTLPDRELIHSALFAEIIAMQKETNREVQNRNLAAFLQKYGVSEKDYNDKIASPLLEKQVQSAVELMNSAGVSGTPTIMVNGKYVVNTGAVSALEQILEIADFLIAKERAAR